MCNFYVIFYINNFSEGLKSFCKLWILLKVLKSFGSSIKLEILKHYFTFKLFLKLPKLYFLFVAFGLYNWRSFYSRFVVPFVRRGRYKVRHRLLMRGNTGEREKCRAEKWCGTFTSLLPRWKIALGPPSHLTRRQLFYSILLYVLVHLWRNCEEQPCQTVACHYAQFAWPKH